MKFKLKTPDRRIKGARMFQIQFEMETVDIRFRDNVTKMILAGLDGGTVQHEQDEPEEKQSAMGFTAGGDDGEG